MKNNMKMCEKMRERPTFLLALMANIPASVQTLLISAPVELGHRRANSSNL